MAAAVAIGSFAFTLIKIALRELSPLSLACGRVVASAAMFVLLVARRPGRRRPIERGDRMRVVLCGFGGSAVFHILFSWGQLHVSIPVAAIIMATMPAMAALGEVVFLGHRLTPGQVGGLVLSVGGCVLIATASTGGRSTLLGALAIAAATATWAAVTVGTRSIAHKYDAWWLNTPGTVLGAAVMIVLAAPRAHEFAALSLKGWLIVVWLGTASSAFIYFAMGRAMTVLSATTASALSTVVTPTSVLVAWVVLGEAPTWLEVVGGAVVVLGVVMVTREPVPELQAELA